MIKFIADTIKLFFDKLKAFFRFDFLSENMRKWIRFSLLILIGLIILLFLCFGNYSLLQKSRAKNKELILENQWLKTELSGCQGKAIELKPQVIQTKEIKIKTLDKGYALYVNGEPFLVVGVGYNPTPVGSGYDHNFFLDKSRPWLIDGELMKAAGINTIRVYSAGSDIEAVKSFIQEMYDNYGIYTE